MLGRCAIAVVLAVVVSAATGRAAAAPQRAGAVLVGFRSHLPASHRRRIADRLRARRLRRISAHAHLLQVDGVDDAIAALRDDPDVRFAEPDYVQTVSGVPNDSSFAMQWAFQNTGQSVGGVRGTMGADEHAEGAWDVTTGTRAVVVAVLDT